MMHVNPSNNIKPKPKFKINVKEILAETGFMFLLFMLIDLIGTIIIIDFKFSEFTYTYAQFQFNIFVAFTYGVIMSVMNWYFNRQI